MLKYQQKLKIQNKSEFVKYLDSIGTVNNSYIADLRDGRLTAITSSDDNTLIVYGEHKCDTDIKTTLNIPDCKKLTRVIDSISGDEIELILNKNNIEYKGNDIKFKYHLYEEGLLTRPMLSVAKIKQFVYDITFTLSKSNIQTILKSSSFTSQTNKLYFYTQNNNLIAELTDHTKHNTDSLALTIGEVDFELQPIPISLDNLRLLTITSDTVKVSINKTYGVMVFAIETKKTNISYIITSFPA